eukprot:3816438-Pyramimonas_sp.AAC.1
MLSYRSRDRHDRTTKQKNNSLINTAEPASADLYGSLCVTPGSWNSSGVRGVRIPWEDGGVGPDRPSGH